MPNSSRAIAPLYDQAMNASLRTLLTDLIDYAGLFPPAACDMPTAAANFARGLGGPEAFILNRFICPASRLDEFSEHARVLLPGTYATSGYREMAHTAEPWALSVVCDRPLDETLELIEAFDSRHVNEDDGLARVRSVEMRVKDSDSIDEAIERIPDDIQIFFEIPLDTDFRGMVAALSGTPGIGAKVRCGGVEPGMIPPTDRLAAFLVACSAADAPFKATAGLHHPVRAEHPLTYESDAPRAVMHGFLNVFLGAALARSLRLDADTLAVILDEPDPDAFTLTDSQAGWRDHLIDTAQLARSRESFCLGYGSCSYTEPLEDLRSLGIL